MIRKLLLASVAAGGLVAVLPASAADLAVRPAPAPAFVAPVVPVPVLNWSGWYIGGNVGGKWGKFSGDITAAPVTGFPATGGGDFFNFNTDWSGGPPPRGGPPGLYWEGKQ